MNVLDAIFTRRSIRQYKDTKIKEEDLKTILSAGMAAPSAGNAQPWRFVVIDNTKNDIRKKIREISPYTAMIEDSPMSILVCADTNSEVFAGYWVIDCSACIENMLLAIHGIGLGGVWTGIYPDKKRMEDFQKLFELPKNIIPHSLIIFGDPDETKSQKDCYDEEIIHYDKW